MKTISESKSPKIPQLLAHNKRTAIGLGGTIVALVILVLAVVVVFTYYPPAKQTVEKLTSSQSSTGAPSGNVPGQIKFTVMNQLAGSAVGSTAYVIYPAAGSVIGGQTYNGGTSSEGGTATSGVFTTALAYAPGTSLLVKLTLSTYNTEYWQVTAPGVTTQAQANGQAALVVIPQLLNPTIAMSITNDKGGSLSTAGAVNFTTLGETSVKLTVTITSTVANTGYLSTADPLNHVNWCAMQQAVESGSYTNQITVSGFPSSAGSFSVGSVRYWQTTLPDGYTVGSGISPNAFNNAACGGSYTIAQGGLSTQTVGITSLGGSTTYSFTIGKGSLAHGHADVLTFQAYMDADPVYATQNSGIASPSSATLGSAFVLNVQD